MYTDYTQLLQKYYPSDEKIITEIINLKAILNLPKGTEHFVSDLHGEFLAFQHVLRNGSGSIKEKIDSCFRQQLSAQERKELAAIIYYPEERIQYIKSYTYEQEELDKWIKETLFQLITLTRLTISKYTHSKVRKSLPQSFAYIIEELLYEKNQSADKDGYYQKIIDECIRLQQGEQLIIHFAHLIQRFVVDHLHVVGDIYDRGPSPDKIIDTLIQHHSVDIQWGNHDIIWMGASSGSLVCMMAVLRICARYHNLDIVEEAYGINLRPIFSFSKKYYQDNPAFRPKISSDDELNQEEIEQITQVHQAVAILQFKLEAALIKRRPEFHMDQRLLFEKITNDQQSIILNNKKYSLNHTCFQTINWQNPSELTSEEKDLLEKIHSSFIQSEKLRKHVQFLLKKGSLYLIYNHNLLIHGCIPLEKDGHFKSLTFNEKNYQGRTLLDFFDSNLRKACKDPKKTENFETDLLWYLWCGECSSLFGKKEMTTFERYFIQDKETHYEEKNAYYVLRNDENICGAILEDFGISPENGHIINGHTPIKEKDGENPIKANGKMIVIDGGFSKPYQKQTGLAGYTLLYNSYGMQLAAHQPFTSIADAVQNCEDIISIKRIVDRELTRKKVCDTEIGTRLKKEITELETLLQNIE